MDNHVSQLYTCDSTENKLIIVSQKGFINNLIVVQYQKYFDSGKGMEEGERDEGSGLTPLQVKYLEFQN